MTTDGNSKQGVRVRPSELARAEIAVAGSFVVGIFTALGIQGELLTRAARNDPALIIVAFSLMIVGLVVPLISDVSAPTWVDGLAIFFVVAGAILTLITGGLSLAKRETPALAMTTTWSETAPVIANVTVTASATSLRSNEDIVLRVASLTPDSDQARWDQCRKKTGPWTDPSLGGTGRVLSWGTSGPDTAGEAEIAVAVRADPALTEYVCAYTELRDRSPSKNDDDRFSWAVYRLTYSSSTPAPARTLARQGDPVAPGAAAIHSTCSNAADHPAQPKGWLLIQRCGLRSWPRQNPYWFKRCREIPVRAMPPPRQHRVQTSSLTNVLVEESRGRQVHDLDPLNVVLHRDLRVRVAEQLCGEFDIAVGVDRGRNRAAEHVRGHTVDPCSLEHVKTWRV